MLSVVGLHPMLSVVGLHPTLSLVGSHLLAGSGRLVYGAISCRLAAAVIGRCYLLMSMVG